MVYLRLTKMKVLKDALVFRDEFDLGSLLTLAFFVLDHGDGRRGRWSRR